MVWRLLALNHSTHHIALLGINLVAVSHVATCYAENDVEGWPALPFKLANSLCSLVADVALLDGRKVIGILEGTDFTVL